MAERLTDEQLEAMLERVRGDKGEIYRNYFLGLREAKKSRRRIAELEAELHEARAWTLGPAINHHSRDAILAAARHLRSLYDTNKTACTRLEAAKIVEDFAFDKHPRKGDDQ